jgi:hypothetical protein
MASITLTIADAVLPRVLNGMVPVPPPGKTQAEAAKDMLIRYIKQTVRDREIAVGTAAALATIDVEVT